jgi:hypothetical protein
VDIIDRLNALRGTAHEVGLAAIEEIVRLRSFEALAIALQRDIADKNREIERLRAREGVWVDEVEPGCPDIEVLKAHVRDLAEIVEGQVGVIARLQRQVNKLRQERSPTIFKVTATHKGDTDDRP